MKIYNFIFQDKSGNDLDIVEVECFNYAAAIALRNKIFATSKLNDLHKITIKSK